MSIFDNHEFLTFLRESPTPFHAVKFMSNMLVEAGFSFVAENDLQDVTANQKMFTTRSGSAILAFKSSNDHGNYQSGLRLVGAHTDSPCLKVKPKPDKYVKGFHQIAIQPYGGVLLAPWFDRDLSLAGHVVYRNTANEIKSCLIDFKDPIGSVPSLAIHLDRSANENRTINAHNDMNVVIGLQKMVDGKKTTFNSILLGQVQKDYPDAQTVLDYNLCFYDVQPPQIIGIDKEFISSARLDNLLSSYVAIKAFIESDDKYPSMFISNDHEEVGSQTEVGAKGPMLKNWLHACFNDFRQREAVIDKSLMLSVDNAHGIHPNFATKHDDNLGPIINEGPVIKYDANQAYATNSETGGILKWLAGLEPEIPIQSFAVRADMRCGSTIGPITATEIGISTVDIGVPTFAMHSIRELAGARDTQALFDLLTRFYNAPKVSL